MYLVASGERPFGNRLLDSDLVRDIMGGLRPDMPDSAPEAYKKLAERCCDADPNKRLASWELWFHLKKIDKDESHIWNTIYHTDITF